MEQVTEPTEKHRPVGDKEVKTRGTLDWLVTNTVRILISLFVPIVTFIGLYLGFIFLRDSNAPKGVVAIVAIIWGVGGVAALYLVSNWMVEKLGDEWRAKIQPFVFVGPAVAILIVYLLYPTIATFRLSLFDRNGEIFVGLQNYVEIFTNRSMFVAFRNNILLWIPFGALFTVVLGLLIAVLADRSKYERTAKALIFMPMAISMVGAAVIWNMIYDINPNVGVLNWLYTNITGNNPQAWTAANQPLEQPLPDRGHDLATDRLRNGALLGGDQGHSIGHHRSGPRGRRHRGAGLLPHHDPLYQRHDHHRHDHSVDLHAEDLRCRPGHDGRPV